MVGEANPTKSGIIERKWLSSAVAAGLILTGCSSGSGGCFPVKDIDGTDYAAGFGYAVYQSESTVPVSYGGSQRDSIELAGYPDYSYTLD